MKIKKLSLVLIPIMLVTLTGCESDEQKALNIYNNDQLTNKEKIDRLMALYYGSYDGHGDYNKAAADRAWDAIEKGNYQKAYNITQTYKSADYNIYAKPYAEKCRVAAPQPDHVYLEIDQGELYTTPKGTFRHSSYYDLVIDMPEMDHNCPIEGILHNQYKGVVECIVAGENERSSNYDTGNNNSAHAVMLSYDTITYRISVLPYIGWAFTYYNDSVVYEYTITLPGNGETPSGQYECEYVGTKTSIYFFNS